MVVLNILSLASGKCYKIDSDDNFEYDEEASRGCANDENVDRQMITLVKNQRVKAQVRIGVY